MLFKKTILLGILMGCLPASAEYSYMDSIQCKRLYYNAASTLAFRSGMMYFPTSNGIGRFSYKKSQSMEELKSKEDEVFKLSFQDRFSSKDKLQTIVDSSSLIIPLVSRLADFKKDSELVNTIQDKCDRVLYYNAWYNNDKDAFKPTDDYTFVMKQIGEPAIFLAAEHCLDKLAETETGKKIAQSIPQGYKEKGKTLLAVTVAQCAGAGFKAIQQESDHIALGLQIGKQLGKNIIIDVTSHAAEKYVVAPVVDKVAEKIAGPGEGYVKTGLNFVANIAVLSAINQTVSKL